MYIGLSLSRLSASTLQAQIVDQLREQIVSGKLAPGAEMPSSRDLALQHDVSRNTVIHAYERLMSEGYLVTERGVRTAVATLLPETCLLVGNGPGGAASDATTTVRAPIVFTGDKLLLPGSSTPHAELDYWPGRPSRTHFPIAAWRRLADDILSGPSAKLTEYGDPAGLPALREAIGQHVSLSRGFKCPAEAVIITSGAQEAINIIARLLVASGTGIVVEDPGYGSATHTFQSYGGRILPVPVDRDGLIAEALPRAGASLAYVTPSHQFPTGAALAPERRQALLAWAYRTGAYIVEDDYDSDYNFSGPPLLSLAGADSGHCVIYVGTFSKSIGAGVRTGFLIVPPQLRDAARAVKAMTNYGHPWLEQAILDRFLRSGAYLRHLRKIRQAYSETLLCLVSQLETHFGAVELWGTHNGMHVMWLLPGSLRPAPAFMAAAMSRGVQVHTLATAGAFSSSRVYDERAILLGYAALNRTQIMRSVDLMATAVLPTKAKRHNGGSARRQLEKR